jgi:hypothetical protein
MKIKDVYWDDSDWRDIVLDDLEAKRKEGITGYGIPTGLLDWSEYSPGKEVSVSCNYFPILGASQLLLIDKRKRDLELAEYLNLITDDLKIDPGKPIFPLWRENAPGLKLETFAPSFWRSRLKNNDDIWNVFNIPGEVAYLDLVDRYLQEDLKQAWAKNYFFHREVPENPLLRPDLWERRAFDGLKGAAWIELNSIFIRTEESIAKRLFRQLRATTDPEKRNELVLTYCSLLVIGGFIPDFMFETEEDIRRRNDAEDEKELQALRDRADKLLADAQSEELNLNFVSGDAIKKSLTQPDEKTEDDIWELLGLERPVAVEDDNAPADAEPTEDLEYFEQYYGWNESAPNIEELSWRKLAASTASFETENLPEDDFQEGSDADIPSFDYSEFAAEPSDEENPQ